MEKALCGNLEDFQVIQTQRTASSMSCISDNKSYLNQLSYSHRISEHSLANHHDRLTRSQSHSESKAIISYYSTTIEITLDIIVRL